MRSIAAAADVNVATVHYYFRTKDAVITEALKHFFEPLLGRLDELAAADLPARQRLEQFLLFLIEKFTANPGVFISIIESMIASNIRNPERGPSAHEKVLLGVIHSGRQRIMKLVREVSNATDESTVTLRSLQVMTNIIHPMLVSTVPLDEFGVDFHDERRRREYVTVLVDSLLV